MEQQCAYLLSAPSSLKSLDLEVDNLPLHALHLKNNTHLTRLRLSSVSTTHTDHEVAALIDIVNQNRTLEELVLALFDTSSNCIAALRRLFSALYMRTVLCRKLKWKWVVWSRVSMSLIS